MTLLQKLFSFHGRLRRRDYIIWQITGLVVGVGVLVTLYLLETSIGVVAPNRLLDIAYILVVAVAAWTALALGTKRLHDSGSTGWWMFLAIAPFGNLLLLWWLFVTNGEPRTNKHGPSPKEKAAPVAEVFA